MYLIRFLPNFAVFFAFCEFRGISRIYRNFTAPRPREISEALFVTGQNSSQVKIFLTWEPGLILNFPCLLGLIHEYLGSGDKGTGESA